MTLNDSLAAALSKIDNSQKVNKTQVEIRTVSKVLKKILDVMKEKLYVGSYEEFSDSKGAYLILNLVGSLNKCAVIKPRSSFKFIECADIEKKYLPARGFGVVIVSTPSGLITLDEAKEKKIGGKLIAYCY